jgi:hypothetical protein
VTDNKWVIQIGRETFDNIKKGRKYKSENGANTDFWIYQVLGRVSIPCLPLTPAVSPISRSGK